MTTKMLYDAGVESELLWQLFGVSYLVVTVGSSYYFL